MRAAAASPSGLAAALVLAVAVLAEQRQKPTTPPAPAAARTDEWAHRQAGAGRCQMILTSGYGYRQFVPLEPFVAALGDNPMDGYPSPLASPPTTTPAAARPTSAAEESSEAPTATPDEQQRLLVLRFQVMAESDAHILLTAQRRSDREAYEVVLGAGNNSYTDFRRLPASVPPRRAFNYSAGVVSGGELRAFWLLADLATGLLAVGPEGGAPILAWVDAGPLRIRYFSLCTWTDVQGTWLYGCDKAGSVGGEAAPQDAEDTSASERLRLHVLTPDKRHAPRSRTAVVTGFTAGRIAVDESTLTLTMTGTLSMFWNDTRMVWSAVGSGAVDHMEVLPSDVWVPVVRAVGRTARDLSRPDPATPGGVLVRHTGHLAGRAPLRLRAHCVPEAHAGDGDGDGGTSYWCMAVLEAKSPAVVVQFKLLATDAVTSPQSPWQYVDSHWIATANDGADSILMVRMRRRGSRVSSIFVTTSIAACAFWVASVLIPEPAPASAARPRAGAGLGLGTPPRPRTLMAAFGVLVTAMSLLSLQASTPATLMAVVHSGVLHLSVGLLLATLALVLPTLAACHGHGLPPLPKPLSRLLRAELFSRLLLGHSSASQRPRWRDCSNGTAPEQVLEMLDAMDAEMSRRDWHTLMLALEKAGAAACLGLALAALAFACR